ncbi:MAG: heavy metal translocating P-type ATPase, partial [Limisphaerales bacterium]
ATAVARDGKAFCCGGCELVYGILSESGLGRFYDLNRHPGTTVGERPGSARWAHLDDPEVRGRLLEFTDGRISRVTFHVPSMHCIACVWLLENLFRLHPGIRRSVVNFPRREVTLTFAEPEVSLSGVAALLARIGYEPDLNLGHLELDPRRAGSASRRRSLQVGIAGFAFGNIMLISLPGYLGLDSLSGPFLRSVFGWLSLFLALPVLIYSAGDYWRSALASYRQRILTLDVPIAAGLAALYGWSAYEIASGHGEGYLDSLAGLIFFLLLGRIFQQRTQERLVFDRDYRAFFPLSVTRQTARGEKTVAISSLQVGDRLVVRHGELVPADATLVRGPALIDYSFVTGEADPVEKRDGDYLYAGGRQTGGRIEVATVKPVSQSYLTSLWNHEVFQKRSDGDLDSLTNRFGRRFTLMVITVALGALAGWMPIDPGRALKAFVSVLIVACPCALALAAPFTLGTAQRWLARRRIFLRNAQVIEHLARIQTVVFDKTGTLTGAHRRAVDFQGEPLSSVEATWVFSLARHSTHPHAVRISDHLAGNGYPEPVRAFLETPGLGLEGSVQGHEIWLGSRAALERYGAGVPDAPLPPGSTVHLAIDGRYRGTFVIEGRLRTDIRRLLGVLGGRFELALLSGDNERERDQFERLFGPAATLNFHQSPLDKLAFIRERQQAGRRVMMVGDGLNDAGALKQSDVGVAVIEGTGAFSPASDIILEASELGRLDRVLELSRRAVWIVRGGFLLSSAYNVVGVSIAAAGVLSPLICAVLMPLSSVTVVLFASGLTSWTAHRLGLGRAPKSAGPGWGSPP